MPLLTREDLKTFKGKLPKYSGILLNAERELHRDHMLNESDRLFRQAWEKPSLGEIFKRSKRRALLYYGSEIKNWNKYHERFCNFSNLMLQVECAFKDSQDLQDEALLLENLKHFILQIEGFIAAETSKQNSHVWNIRKRYVRQKVKALDELLGESPDIATLRGKLEEYHQFFRNHCSAILYVNETYKEIVDKKGRYGTEKWAPWKSKQTMSIEHALHARKRHWYERLNDHMVWAGDRDNALYIQKNGFRFVADQPYEAQPGFYRRFLDRVQGNDIHESYSNQYNGAFFYHRFFQDQRTIAEHREYQENLLRAAQADRESRNNFTHEGRQNIAPDPLPLRQQKQLARQAKFRLLIDSIREKEDTINQLLQSGVHPELITSIAKIYNLNNRFDDNTNSLTPFTVTRYADGVNLDVQLIQTIHSEVEAAWNEKKRDLKENNRIKYQLVFIAVCGGVGTVIGFTLGAGVGAAPGAAIGASIGISASSYIVGFGIGRFAAWIHNSCYLPRKEVRFKDKLLRARVTDEKLEQLEVYNSQLDGLVNDLEKQGTKKELLNLKLMHTLATFHALQKQLSDLHVDTSSHYSEMLHTQVLYIASQIQSSVTQHSLPLTKGFGYTSNDNGSITITTIHPGGPAEAAGLQVWDTLTPAPSTSHTNIIYDGICYTVQRGSNPAFEIVLYPLPDISQPKAYDAMSKLLDSVHYFSSMGASHIKDEGTGISPLPLATTTSGISSTTPPSPDASVIENGFMSEPYNRRDRSLHVSDLRPLPSTPLAPPSPVDSRRTSTHDDNDSSLGIDDSSDNNASFTQKVEGKKGASRPVKYQKHDYGIESSVSSSDEYSYHF